MLKVEKSGMKPRLMLIAVMVFVFIISLINTSAFNFQLFINQNQHLGTFSSNSCVNLIQFCENCSFVNISAVVYPNSSITAINKIMTKSGVNYNYSFCSTSLSGDYTYNTVGDPFGSLSSETITFSITPTGQTFSLMQGIVYTFFLILLLMGFYSSYLVVKNNPFGKDIITDSNKYDMHKKNRIKFYWSILKAKSWIIGLFGIYLFLFLFTAYMNNFVRIIGISDIDNFLININSILAWLAVPFVIFWIAYLILSTVVETQRILKYQFGGFTRR